MRTHNLEMLTLICEVVSFEQVLRKLRLRGNLMLWMCSWRQILSSSDQPSAGTHLSHRIIMRMFLGILIHLGVSVHPYWLGKIWLSIFELTSCAAKRLIMERKANKETRYILGDPISLLVWCPLPSVPCWWGTCFDWCPTNCVPACCLACPLAGVHQGWNCPNTSVALVLLVDSNTTACS